MNPWSAISRLRASSSSRHFFALLGGCSLVAGLVFIGMDLLGHYWVLRRPDLAIPISLFKGVGFVCITILLLYWVLRPWKKDLQASQLRDSHQRQQLRELDQFRELVIDNAMVWINVLDPQWRITLWNKAAEQISGYRRDEVLDNPAIWEWLYPDPDYRASIGAKVTEILEHDTMVEGFETRIRCKQGEEKIIAWNSRRFFGEDGTLMGSIAIGQDITARKLAEMELERLATHDSLTGLYNRHELMRRMQDDVARAERFQHPLCLLLIDIDHFKQINDRFGHQAGDRVLNRFGTLLKEATRHVDYAGRYGGEELVIVLPETDLQEGFEIAERLHNRIESERWSQAGSDIGTITISIGVVAYPDLDGGVDELFLAADLALYRAKNGGRNQVCIAA